MTGVTASPGWANSVWTRFMRTNFRLHNSRETLTPWCSIIADNAKNVVTVPLRTRLNSLGNFVTLGGDRR
jgi:hypothetical protein